MDKLTNSSIAGAILAGGKSSRMGKDKASLELNGKTLLQHMESVLRGADLQDIYISRKSHIADIIENYGALSGIHTILSEVSDKHKHVIFVPVDMPALTSELISQLVTAPDEAQLVHFSSYKMPFRISTNPRWLELAEKMLKQGDDVSIGGFYKSICSKHLIKTVTYNELLINNINTVEEWEMFNESITS